MLPKLSLSRPTTTRRKNQSVRETESLESRTLLSAVMVTSSADSGDGSFRDAIEQANADSSITKIKFKNSVDLVNLESTVEFTGAQDLKIDGKNVTLQTVGDDIGQFNLFESTGNANLSLQKMTLIGGLNGIYVPISADAEGTVSFEGKNLTVLDSDLFGLHIADQLNDSDASIELKLNKSNFFNNGIGDLDYDGVRVDEGGEGDIYAEIKNSRIDGNGGDGLELDERGDGSVYLTVKNSTFDDNGFFNEADLDDGLDIDEAGDGGIYASIMKTSLSYNYDEGLDLDEEGEGDVELMLKKVDASWNNDEGIKLDEEQDGDVYVDFKNVLAFGNYYEEGIAIEEADFGDFFAKVRNVDASQNGKDGIDFTETGEGDFFADFKKVQAFDNAENGVKLEEEDEGTLNASVKKIVSEFNGEYGLAVYQETVDFDSYGLLLLRQASLFDNYLGDLDTWDVYVE
ncbi:hypothetical protein AB1L42_10975 [Thalassoglobus sp. JC818]|uniref:hypothetical protein n=1 Tax=Thalassoglobus sp. JC818 TaxID=3232136 RepID=UPI0034574499